MKSYRILFLSLLSVLFLSVNARDTDRLDLSGPWSVVLDSLDRGIAEQWYADAAFADKANLPGTLCDAGLGRPCGLKPVMEKEVFLNLKRKYDYVGPAWYSKTVNIPSDWKGKRTVLTLERVIWRSQVWVNGQPVKGFRESLTTPHRYDITDKLKPGKPNVIVLRIDNSRQHDISVNNLAHAYTNDTQTMWNGVLGRIDLEAQDGFSVGELRIVPDVEGRKIAVTVSLDGAQPGKGRITFGVTDPSGRALQDKVVDVAGSETSFDYAIDDVMLWDEFNPALYHATVKVDAKGGSASATETFGMRRLSNDNAQLHINGHRIFLRGALECCIFPLTGYPPTDEAGWRKVFNTAREYGLNHLRFHSWCPPEAAFNVADSMGLYLQVELPVWSTTLGGDKSVFDFLAEEALRISREYGNHPSFCFWSMGNELQRDFTALDTLMTSIRKHDPRHLYATTSFTFEPGHGTWPEPHDDYWITQWTKKGWVRGQGVFDEQPASFDKDFQASVEGQPVPIVTHEIGQYSVFPNLKECSKYTGNLMPLNFEAVARDLDRKGHPEWAEQNLQASGRLAVILYKEEIERALKTPGFSGFQLLGLQDFPGQGTALVGILDAFWESKGLISSADFRAFCSPVVPLARFAKATYTADETFRASVEVANFGASTLPGAVISWTLSSADGRKVAAGELPAQDIAVGNGHTLGEIAVPLSGVTEAGQLKFAVSINGTQYHNSWNVYVYPQAVGAEPSDVLYTRSFAEARKALAEGRKVLLNPLPDEQNGLEGKFVQVFWSPVHFPTQAGTMGIWCDPKHPALAQFPTDSHSDWQWWDICKSGRTLVLDSLSANITPIVRMTDNFYKNRNLGLVFEANVGKGRLVMCSPDLGTALESRPVARQMRHSIMSYMASQAFAPKATLDFDEIERLFYNAERKKIEKKSIYD